MSEQLPEMPSTYGELKILFNIETISDEVLEAKARYYTELIDRGQLNERQTNEVFKILDRIQFEIRCRNGYYKQHLGNLALDLYSENTDVKGWD